MVDEVHESLAYLLVGLERRHDLVDEARLEHLWPRVWGCMEDEGQPSASPLLLDEEERCAYRVQNGQAG